LRRLRIQQIGKIQCWACTLHPMICVGVDRWYAKSWIELELGWDATAGIGVILFYLQSDDEAG